MRAATKAASVPAWPPPTTMTSNSEGKFMDRLGQTFGRGRIIRSFILNETLIYPKFLHRPALVWQNIVSRGT
jgi:hypothetical protein